MASWEQEIENWLRLHGDAIKELIKINQTDRKSLKGILDIIKKQRDQIEQLENRIMEQEVPPKKLAYNWRHKKRGSEYRIVATGLCQISTYESFQDGQEVVIYQSKEGNWYVRPLDEFYDGRFEDLNEEKK